MTGKGHLVSGSILMADTYLCGCFLPHLPVSAIFIETVDNFVNTHFDVFAHQDNFIFRIFTVALSIVFYYLGLLLPDIDKKSMISHIFKFSLPITHRGLTHTIYVLILIIIGSVTFYPLRFLGLGFLVHVLIDSLSPAGWVPFYPIGRYYVRNETVITKDKHLVLYTSDGYSEDILLIIMFGTSMLTFICLYVCFIA
jgi:membrane-bound metal-dependent hydrolase YbcI (DUF457 family)